MTSTPTAIDLNSSFEEVVQFAKEYRKTFIEDASKEIAEFGENSGKSDFALMKLRHRIEYINAIAYRINPTLRDKWISYVFTERENFMKQFQDTIAKAKLELNV